MGRAVKNGAAAGRWRRAGHGLVKSAAAAALCAWFVMRVPWADTARAMPDGSVMTKAGLLTALRAARVAPLLAACGCAVGATLAAVPVILGGLGITENLYAWFLGPVASPAHTVAFALLVRCTLLAGAAPGVAVLLVTLRRRGGQSAVSAAIRPQAAPAHVASAS